MTPSLPEDITGDELLEVMSMIVEVGVTDLKTLLLEHKKLMRENTRLKQQCSDLEKLRSYNKIEICVNKFGYGNKWQMGFSLDDDD